MDVRTIWFLRIRAKHTDRASNLSFFFEKSIGVYGETTKVFMKECERGHLRTSSFSGEVEKLTNQE